MIFDITNTETTSGLPPFVFPAEFITMQLLQTPIQYFEEDIQRAKNLLIVAKKIDEDNIIKSDILRSAWMMAVGATDAYFCDAYADLVARTLQAKEREPDCIIPEKLTNQKITLGNYFDLNSEGGWRWRNYARRIIEKESVLSLGKIKDLMNIFLREKHKILNVETIEVWILHREYKYRLVGILPGIYQKMSKGDKKDQRGKTLKQIQKHYGEIFQRRNDCIHNCDRPRSSIQPISYTDVEKIIEDIEFLVNRCQEHFIDEFPLFLTEQCKFSAANKTKACL